MLVNVASRAGCDASSPAPAVSHHLSENNSVCQNFMSRHAIKQKILKDIKITIFIWPWLAIMLFTSHKNCTCKMQDIAKFPSIPRKEHILLG